MHVAPKRDIHDFRVCWRPSEHRGTTSSFISICLATRSGFCALSQRADTRVSWHLLFLSHLSAPGTDGRLRHVPALGTVPVVAVPLVLLSGPLFSLEFPVVQVYCLPPESHVPFLVFSKQNKTTSPINSGHITQVK